MKKILFPFELNNLYYQGAYVYAVKIARNLNAELIMFNVFQLDIDDDITEEKYNKLKKENWVRAYSQVSKYNKHFLDNQYGSNMDLRIKVDHRFIHGKFTVELRAILKDEIIDLIVLPISDNKEFNKKHFKIIQDEIIEKNRANLLIVPFQSIFEPIRNIVFATDLKKLHAYKNYLNDVLKYANMFDSTIHFLHISPKEKALLPEDSAVYRSIMEIIEIKKKHVFKCIYGKDVVESIKQYNQKNDADLLVVVKHEEFFLDTLLHKSVSGEVSMKSKIPVLVMREKDDY